MIRILTTALAAIIFAAPIAAASQDLPSYAQPANAAPPGDEQIRGRITAFDGGFSLSVRDERGFVDNVVLHQGTIINPTGLTLAPGMIVSVLGYNRGSTFAANEIDTPYAFTEGVPYYGGHPWDYYGPSVSLGFFFGNVGWWHGGGFRGGYRWYGGARYYTDVHVRSVYRTDASFRGRDVVAPREHGGYYHASSHTSSAHRGGGGGGHHR